MDNCLLYLFLEKINDYEPGIKDHIQKITEEVLPPAYVVTQYHIMTPAEPHSTFELLTSAEVNNFTKNNRKGYINYIITPVECSRKELENKYIYVFYSYNMDNFNNGRLDKLNILVKVGDYNPVTTNIATCFISNHKIRTKYEEWYQNRVLLYHTGKK